MNKIWILGRDGEDPFVEYRNLPKKDWHDYEVIKADEARSGPGEHGAPVAVPKDEATKKLQDELYRANGYDVSFRNRNAQGK